MEKYFKVGDKFVHKIDGDVWEITGECTGEGYPVVCIKESNHEQAYLGAEQSNYPLHISDFWEYIEQKSNNFKVIYEILNG